MTTKNTNEPTALLFSIEQKDEKEDRSDSYRIEQLSLALEDYKKNYAEFVDIAVHDLESPVRKLSIFIERLTTKYKNISEDDVEAQEWITRINGCLADLRSLTDGLAELSIVTSDTVKYNSCNTKEIVQEVLHELEREIKEKKAVISQSDLPVIEGSQTQLRRLFKNLIENSLRFGKKNSSLEIEIKSSGLSKEETRLYELDTEKEYFKIEISDNGIGFKQAYAQKIFQPFVRLNGKSAFAGNGLGLAICKKIIDNHKGILCAEGIENTGARFIIIIPETHN